MTGRSTTRIKCLGAALAVCLAATHGFSQYVEDKRGIISQPILFFPDGTLIQGANGDDSLTDVDENGLFEVLPGDIIKLPDGTEFVVPELPGYPNGTPYEYDPSALVITGGSPQGTVSVDGTTPPSPEVSYPGSDGVYGNDDDIVITTNDFVFIDTDNGYVIVNGTGADITHKDGSALEGGAVPAGSVLAAPDIIVRPGTDSGTTPADSIQPDGTIRVAQGNTIDKDGDGMEPWVVPEPGVYDPATGLFYPDSGEDPYEVPKESDPDEGDGEPVIESIWLDDANVYLSWTNNPSSGIYLSEIWSKVLLTDPTWETLQNGSRSVVITETNAIIPRALENQESSATPGTYHFFKRVVPNHQHNP